MNFQSLNNEINHNSGWKEGGNFEGKNISLKTLRQTKASTTFTGAEPLKEKCSVLLARKTGRCVLIGWGISGQVSEIYLVSASLHLQPWSIVEHCLLIGKWEFSFWLAEENSVRQQGNSIHWGSLGWALRCHCVCHLVKWRLFIPAHIGNEAWIFLGEKPSKGFKQERDLARF